MMVPFSLCVIIISWADAINSLGHCSVLACLHAAYSTNIIINDLLTLPTLPLLLPLPTAATKVILVKLVKLVKLVILVP